MKTIINITLTLTLLFNTGLIFSQEPTFDFTILSEHAAYLGQDMEISSTLSKSGDSIAWTQINNGFSQTIDFTMTSSSGNWDLDTSLGQVTYSLTTESEVCELILSGQQNDLFATLIFAVSSNQEEQYIFNVNAIIYQ